MLLDGEPDIKVDGKDGSALGSSGTSRGVKKLKKESAEISLVTAFSGDQSRFHIRVGHTIPNIYYWFYYLSLVYIP